MLAKKIFLSNIIQAFNTVANFILGLLLAYYFGATKEMDAFVAAMNFVLFLNTLFLTAQGSVFIPFITKIETEESRKIIISAILKCNFLLFLSFTLLFIFGAPYISQLITPGMDDANKVKVSWLIRIFCGTLLSGNVISLGFALLDFNFKFERRYLIQLSQIVVSISMLLLLASHCGIYGAGAALLSGNIISFILVFKYLRANWVDSSKTAFPTAEMKLYFIILLPTLISASFVWAIKYVEIFAASFQQVGSLAYLGYCQRMEIGTSVIAIVICSIYYPLFSRLIKEGKRAEYLNRFYSGFQLISTIVLSLVAFILLFSAEIIQILFQHGNFNSSDTAALSKALRLYGFVLIGAPFGTYMANVYFSFSKTNIAMWCSMGSSCMQILCIAGLVPLLGFSGIVLSASIGFFTGNVLQAFSFKRIIPEYRHKDLLSAIKSPFIAVLGATTILLCVKFIFPPFGQGFVVKTAFVVTMFCLYLLILLACHLFLKTPFVVDYFNKFKTRIRILSRRKSV